MNDDKALGLAIAEQGIKQALDGLRNAPPSMQAMLLQRLRDMADRGDPTAIEVVKRFDNNQ